LSVILSEELVARNWVVDFDGAESCLGVWCLGDYVVFPIEWHFYFKFVNYLNNNHDNNSHIKEKAVNYNTKIRYET